MSRAYRTVLLWAVLMLGATLPCSAITFASGDILISNHGGSNVQLLHPATGTVSTVVNVSGTPIGLAFDTSGFLYINVNTGIQRFDPVTNTLSASFFTGVGQREGLTFDPVTGHLFSASFGANRVEEVDLAGNLVRTITIPGTSNPIGISARGGNLAITDFSSGKLFVGTTTGSTFTAVGGVVNPGNTYAPDFDALGNIYVNDFGGRNVKFTALGGGLFSGPATFISGLSAPANGLSIGDDGSLTLDEFGANAISIWNGDGTLRQRFFGIANPDELVVYAPIRSGIDPGPGGTVPEPASLLLLGTGLASAGVRRWRARKKT